MLAIMYAAALWLGPLVNDTSNRSDAGALSATDLARRLTRHHDALNAVSIVYSSVPESLEGKPAGHYWRRAVAVRRNGMFKSENSHGHLGLPWVNDPIRKSLIVTPSGASVLDHLSRTLVDIDPRVDDPLNSARKELIFDLLCWWPFADGNPPQNYGYDYSMPKMLEPRSYRLLSKRQLVRSRLCYTFIVNDILTVWCDCNRPERILKSERYDPDTGAIDSRFEMMEHEEVGDNIWLPKRFRIVRFDTNAHKPQLRKRVVYDATFLVEDITVNEDVTESNFQHMYSPGTVRIVRLPHQIQYESITNGQLAHFNSIVKWCRFGSSRATPVHQRKRGNSLLVFMLSFLVGCVLVFATSVNSVRARELSRDRSDNT